MRSSRTPRGSADPSLGNSAISCRLGVNGVKDKLFNMKSKKWIG